MKKYIFLACSFVLIIGTMVYGIVINNQNEINTDLTMQNNALIAQIDTTMDRYNKLQEDYNLLCETHKSTLNQLQQERSLYAFDRQRFTEQVQSLKQQIFDLNVNKEENEQRIAELEAEVAELEQQIANIDAEVLALETENAQLLTSVNNYETQISNLNNQIDEMVAELNAKNELWQKLMNGTITEITAEDLQGVTEIRPYAFYNCLNLTSVEIPEGITVIGEYAFQKCSSLENLTLCNSINTIGQYSFSNTAINNLSLPSELNSLGKFSFADCKNLSDIDFSKALSLTNISSAFQGSGMKKVILPSNILDITSAFSNCKELEEIVIGGKVFFTQPGFSGCSKLTKIVFKDVPQSSDIKLIGWGTPVKTIIFEIGFTGLYYDTFIGNCATLEAIIVNKDTAPILFKIDDVSLLGNTKFYVPDEAVEAYKAHARWSAIADSILPMSDYESLENQEAA